MSHASLLSGEDEQKSLPYAIRLNCSIGADGEQSSVLCIEDDDSNCVKSTLEPWADKVGEKFNSNQHWFTVGWQNVCRAKSIAKAQVEYWVESVLTPGSEVATKRNLRTLGGVACVISAKSSGLGRTMFAVSDQKSHASAGGLSREWSLTEVPKDAFQNDFGNLSSKVLLQDWKAVVAWQFYTIKKKRVRSRMRTIWSEFFERSWGPLDNPSSVSASTRVPKHSGQLLDKGKFDFTVSFD